MSVADVILIAVIFIVSATFLMVRHNKNKLTRNLSHLLSLLGLDDEEGLIITNSYMAKWHGEYSNIELGMEYIEAFHSTLAIKIPFASKNIFYLINPAKVPVSAKEAVYQTNQICFGNIQNETLKKRISNLLNDQRFERLNTRNITGDTKFPLLPAYDAQNNIINKENKIPTDTIAVLLTRPLDKAKRSNDKEFTGEFLASTILLLSDIKKDLNLSMHE